MTDQRSAARERLEKLIAVVRSAQDNGRRLGSIHMREALRDLMSDVVALEGRAREVSVCPCRVIAPCGPNCSCSNGLLSGGCARCASYGSREQQESAARTIADRIATRDEWKARALVAEASEETLARDLDVAMNDSGSQVILVIQSWLAAYCARRQPKDLPPTGDATAHVAVVAGREVG